jgi:HTH-type transcriptional regulator/antitoxin HigA
MSHKIIHTKKEYEAALQRMEHIFDAKMGTPEGEEADELSMLIKNYEDIHYPIDKPDPQAAIQFRMEQLGLSNGSI